MLDNAKFAAKNRIKDLDVSDDPSHLDTLFRKNTCSATRFQTLITKKT